MNDEFLLRPYRVEDEDAAVMLWQRTWQQAYPSIDFAARVPWWRARWRNELVPNAAIIIAEHQGAPVGFGHQAAHQLIIRKICHGLSRRQSADMTQKGVPPIPRHSAFSVRLVRSLRIIVP